MITQAGEKEKEKTMKYFDNITSLDKRKKEFRRLAMGTRKIIDKTAHVHRLLDMLKA